jgi:hypothetical protein
MCQLAPLRGSLLQRGAPTRRASVIFFARDFFSRFAREGKGFYSVLAPPAHARTRNSLYDSKNDEQNSNNTGTFKGRSSFDILV